MLLKDNQVVESDTNLDDFVNLIYKPGEQRLEILQWIISKMYESCGNHLEKKINQPLGKCFKVYTYFAAGDSEVASSKNA